MPLPPDELLEHIALLCGKVCVDHEENALVQMDDLVELRDRVNEVRHRVAGGEGYKAFTKLVRPEK